MLKLRALGPPLEDTAIKAIQGLPVFSPGDGGGKFGLDRWGVGQGRGWVEVGELVLEMLGSALLPSLMLSPPILFVSENLHLPSTSLCF